MSRRSAPRSPPPAASRATRLWRLIVLLIFRRPVSACLRSKGSAGLLAALLLRASVAGADLPVLAALDGASANEGVVLEYVRRAVGRRQEVDNTGSLTA